MFKFIKSLLIASILPLGAISGGEKVEPIVILGGGVGSLTSAIYIGRAGQSPLIIEGPNPGGLLTQSHSVQNWPGEMEISGALLTDKMHAQAEANGARFLNEEVVGVDFSKRPLTITTRSLDGKGAIRQIQAQSCIIAMGSKPNFLGIPGEQAYWGKGVTNCAICDGSLYKGKKVAVVGGGDAAVLEALYLSNIAKEVTVYVRKESFRAIEEKRVAQLKAKGNVKIVFNTTLEEVKGDREKVTGVTVKSGSSLKTVPVDAVFLAIGSTPNSELFKSVLDLDEKGYIVLKKDQQTSLEGVYAIGDIVDPVYKQAISAAGDGAKAALQAEQYLSDQPNLIAKQELVIQRKKNGSKKVIEISSVEQFNAELDQAEMPIVIDFYATWCGPCKRISPIMESAASHLAGKVKFLKVNVDDFQELSATYQIKAMPTVILLDPSGKIIEEKVGFDPIAQLLKRLESAS